MFLLVRSYVVHCDSGKVKEKEIVGNALGECGLSITITMLANCIAFCAASLVPIPAVQVFALQVRMYFEEGVCESVFFANNFTGF